MNKDEFIKALQKEVYDAGQRIEAFAKTQLNDLATWVVGNLPEGEVDKPPADGTIYWFGRTDLNEQSNTFKVLKVEREVDGVMRTFRKFALGEPMGAEWKVNSAKDELAWAKKIAIPSTWRLTSKTKEKVQRGDIILAELTRNGVTKKVWLLLCKDGSPYRGVWKNTQQQILNRC
jgi:hypothetical protein